MFKDHAPKTFPKYLTEREVSLILHNAKSDSFRNYLIILTLWRTGVRASELISIRKNDIDFANGTILIRKGKGNKDRIIPVENELGNLLGLYTDQISYRDIVYPLSRRQLNNIVKKYLPNEIKASVHTFRHSFAVHCLKKGMNVRTLQKILGHSSLQTTQIYLDIISKDIKDDFKKVDWNEDNRSQL